MFALLFALYSLLALSAYELFGAGTIGVTFFPPAGLTYAAFLALPRRHLPMVAAAIVLGELVVDVGKGYGIWWSLGWAAANLTEPLVGATITRRLTPTLGLNRRTATAVVVGGLIVGPAIGAAIGATTLSIANDRGWATAFPDIWSGDALGVLVVAPVALVVARPRLLPPERRVRAIDAALLTALLVAVGVLFWTTESAAVAYGSIPLLAWATLRVGTRGLAVASLALAAVSTSATARDRGPWEALAGTDPQTQLGRQQLFLLAAIGGAWLLMLEVRERTRAVERMRSIATDAALLERALHAGRMGVWTWDARTNVIGWDRQLEQLYGLPPGGFDGSFETWLARVHPDDRERLLAELSVDLDQGRLFHIEHRCVWPDGSVHHIDGIGEVAFDEAGNPIGAFGVAANVDERKRADEERARLLEVERAARHRADLRAGLNEALGYSLDVRELADRIVSAAVPALAEWCSLVLTLDQPSDEPLTALAHVDPDLRHLAARYQARIDFGPSSRYHTAYAIRTGRTLFVPSIDDDLIASAFDDEEMREIVRSLDVRSAIVVALPSPEGPLGALELVRTSASPAFTDADLAVVEELAQTIGAALQSAFLYRRQLRARRALDTLQQITGHLNAANTTDEVAEVVVRHGSHALMANSAMLFLTDERGDLVLTETTGVDEIDTSPWAVLTPDSHGPVTEAVRTRSVVLVRSLDELQARFPDVRPPDSEEGAVVALPILLGDEAIGGVVFTFRHRRPFFDEELSMLETLAGRCAGSIERARLFEQQRTAALTLQRRLLPELPPMPEWLQVGAQYEPAPGGEVGGDWYQLHLLGDGRCVAALGDAVGRGITAAAAMGQLRAAIAGATGVDPHPSTVLAATNEFAAPGADTQCASLAYALIEHGSDSIVYAAAGHPPPILLRADGTVETLTHGRGPLLGMAPMGKPFAYATAAYHPGDTLVLYSDGLIERRDESIDTGVERLADAVARLAHLPPDEMSAALVRELGADRVSTDDVAVLVLRRTTGSC